MFILIAVCCITINVVAIFRFRKSDVTPFKYGFISGIVGLCSFPLAVIGVFFSAINLQNIFDDKAGYLIFFFIFVFSTFYSLYAVLRYKPEWWNG